MTISIHALVKRATVTYLAISFSFLNFNPRPREEGDPRLYRCQTSACNFNPRPREEGDVTEHPRQCIFIDFNPRPREEGDCESVLRN